MAALSLDLFFLSMYNLHENQMMMKERMMHDIDPVTAIMVTGLLAVTFQKLTF